MGDSHTINEFKAIAEDTGHADWMVKMFGGLTHDPALQTEAKLDVLLRPVKGVTSKYIPSKLSERIVQVGVGQLPILRVSSVWSNGMIHDNDVYPYAVTETYRINIPEDGFQLQVNGNDKDQWDQPYTTGVKWSAPNEFILSKFVVVPAKNSNGNEVDLVIPTMVLNQAYFAQSSLLSRVLVDGVYRDDISLDTLVKLKSCGMYDTDGLTEIQILKIVEGIHQKYGGSVTKDNLHRLFVVKARDHVRDEECYVIARALSDQFARGVAANVGNSAMVQRAEQGEAVGAVYPAGLFPFTGESEIRVLAYKNPLVQTADVTRVMVFAIDECSKKLNFDNLLVLRTNDGTEANQETDIPNEDKQPSNWKRKESKEDLGSKTMQSATDASKDSPVETVDVPFKRGIGSSGIDLLKKTKESSKYKNVPMQVKHVTTPPMSGTSEGLYNRADLGRTNLDSSSQRTGYTHSPALEANLENFDKILNEINNLENFKARLRSGHVHAGLYPAVPKSDNKRDWALIETGKPGLRHFMVGDITYREQHFVLMDVEKRETKGKSQEGFLYEVVRKFDFAYLLDAELSQLIVELSKAKGRMKNIEKMPRGVVRTWRTEVEMVIVDDHVDPDAPIFVESEKKLYGLRHCSDGISKTVDRIVKHIENHVSGI